MAIPGKENIQCILQAKCTECGSMNDNYTVRDNRHKSSSVVYDIECDCGQEATVSITKDGLSHDEVISYSEASWTDDIVDEDEGEDEDNERLESEKDHLH